MTNEAFARALSADRASTDPAEDLFGHAPFAWTLANAIQGHSHSDGIVLAQLAGLAAVLRRCSSRAMTTSASSMRQFAR